MKKYSILLICLIISSCHVLQKDKQTLKKSTQKENYKIESKHTSSNEQRQLLLSDSSDTGFMLVLWPKGSFKLSLANGFEGEAEKILIKSKQTHKKEINLKQEVKHDGTLLRANYNKEKESTTIRKNNKFRIGTNWIWLLILSALCLGYLLYRRFCN